MIITLQQLAIAAVEIHGGAQQATAEVLIEILESILDTAYMYARAVLGRVYGLGIGYGALGVSKHECASAGIVSRYVAT